MAHDVREGAMRVQVWCTEGDPPNGRPCGDLVRMVGREVATTDEERAQAVERWRVRTAQGGDMAGRAVEFYVPLRDALTAPEPCLARVSSGNVSRAKSKAGPWADAWRTIAEPRSKREARAKRPHWRVAFALQDAAGALTLEQIMEAASVDRRQARRAVRVWRRRKHLRITKRKSGEAYRWKDGR